MFRVREDEEKPPDSEVTEEEVAEAPDKHVRPEKKPPEELFTVEVHLGEPPDEESPDEGEDDPEEPSTKSDVSITEECERSRSCLLGVPRPKSILIKSL